MNPESRQSRPKFVNLVALISDANKRRRNPAADQCAHVNQLNDLEETQLELDGQTLITLSRKPQLELDSQTLITLNRKPTDATADPVEMVNKSSQTICLQNAVAHRGTSTSPTPKEPITAHSSSELSDPLSVTIQELDDAVNLLLNENKGFESNNESPSNSAEKFEENVNDMIQCEALELGKENEIEEGLNAGERIILGPQRNDEQLTGDGYHKPYFFHSE